MRKTIFPAAAVVAVALATVAVSGGAAQAQCYWNGYGTSCAAPPPPAYQTPYYGAYPAQGAQGYAPYYGAPDYGYQSGWPPANPGPRASGH